LRTKYSQPIYGKPDGIPSLNFSSADGFVWLRKSESGQITDPYALLKEYAKELIPDDLESAPEARASIIAEGGAAATAYARLQFESMKTKIGRESKKRC